MGEISEMMLDGTLCQVCGAAMDDVWEGFVAPGYPRTCNYCKGGERHARSKTQHRHSKQTKTRMYGRRPQEGSGLPRG